MLESRVESARTRADHDGLATHYEQEAKKARTSAQVHLRMLTTYQGHTGYRSAAGFARHCNRLAQKYADAEEEYLGLAKLHRKMAAEAKE